MPWPHVCIVPQFPAGGVGPPTPLSLGNISLLLSCFTRNMDFASPGRLVQGRGVEDDRIARKTDRGSLPAWRLFKSLNSQGRQLAFQHNSGLGENIALSQQSSTMLKQCFSSLGDFEFGNVPCDPNADISACCGGGSVCVTNLACVDGWNGIVPEQCTLRNWADVLPPECPCPPPCESVLKSKL